MTDNEFHIALAVQLKLLRERAQLSQTELADRLKVHRNTLCKWENAETAMPTIAFLHFCAVLQADAGEVLKRILHSKPMKGQIHERTAQ